MQLFKKLNTTATPPANAALSPRSSDAYRASPRLVTVTTEWVEITAKVRASDIVALRLAFIRRAFIRQESFSPGDFPRVLAAIVRGYVGTESDKVRCARGDYGQSHALKASLQSVRELGRQHAEVWSSVTGRGHKLASITFSMEKACFERLEDYAGFIEVSPLAVIRTAISDSVREGRAAA